MEKDFLKISESESDFEKKIELVTENMEELNISKVNRIKIKAEDAGVQVQLLFLINVY